MKPVLILLSAGDSKHREYMLDRISRRCSVVLMSPQPPSWESPYIADHVLIAPSDRRSAVSAAVGVSKKRSVAGVLTYHEPCIELAAEIGETLGLPHCGLEAAAICRDKYRAREAFRLASVPSAQCRIVGSGTEARHAAEEIGYPVVVKPRALCASFGVSLVEDETAIDEAFACARSSKLPEAWDHREGVLVEEYLDGPEISVDSLVRGGAFTPLIYAKKILGFAPYFEEVGHIVAPFEALTEDTGEIRDILAQAHRALGIVDSATHAELRLTSRGPRIVEVNGRTGGDLIPYVAYLTSGLDIAGASADVAVGAAPELSDKGGGVGGIRFFYPRSAGRFEAAQIDPAFGQPSWLLRVTWLVEPGTELKPTPGEYYYSRIGFAIVEGKSLQECEERLEAVERAVTVNLAPLS